jgi:hypothetical protein
MVEEARRRLGVTIHVGEEGGDMGRGTARWSRRYVPTESATASWRPAIRS